MSPQSARDLLNLCRRQLQSQEAKMAKLDFAQIEIRLGKLQETNHEINVLANKVTENATVSAKNLFTKIQWV